MTFEDFLFCSSMVFEDFLAYLKTLDLPNEYSDAIATLKPYGRVSLQFERVLGQPGGAFVLYDFESLLLFYQFVYWAVNRGVVDVTVSLNEASYEFDLSMDIMISNVSFKTCYEEEMLVITRMDLAALLIHLRDDYKVDLTIDAGQFVCDTRISHGRYTPFVNCNVLFERTM